MAAHSAKGSAKIECSHLIISSVRRRLWRTGIESIVNAARVLGLQFHVFSHGCRFRTRLTSAVTNSTKRIASCSNPGVVEPAFFNRLSSAARMTDRHFGGTVSFAQLEARFLEITAR